MRFARPFVPLVLALAAAVPALAAEMTPVGTWTTIDDTTHKPKSVVQISEKGGKLEGKVLQVFDSEQGPHPLCHACEGERKNKPIEGMTILWDVTKDGDVWDGGRILDPKNGKVYKVRLTPTGNGDTLDVHGYIGFALLGRSQVWERRAGP
jgi:uncharacterized protein (DUF2147 family)